MEKLEQVKNFINEKISSAYEYIGQELYFAWWEAVNADEKGNYVLDQNNEHIKTLVEEIGRVELMFEIWDKAHELQKGEKND